MTSDSLVPVGVGIGMKLRAERARRDAAAAANVQARIDGPQLQPHETVQEEWGNALAYVTSAIERLHQGINDLDRGEPLKTDPLANRMLDVAALLRLATVQGGEVLRELRARGV